MKKIYLVQKTIAFILFTACTFFVSPNLYAQREAITDDMEAGDLTGTVNTGTDVIPYDGKTIQVMVADGASNLFYWNVGGNTGSLVFDSWAPKDCDPDVVVQRYEDGIYALVVYINAATQVGWKVYYLNGTSFTFLKSGTLGNGNGSVISGYHGCSNPNVDVNSSGKVVVTWAESLTTNHLISYGTTESNWGFHQYVDIDRGDIYAAYGIINGDGPDPNSVLKGNMFINGDRISQFGGHLFEKNIKPDVAIADGDDINNITVTYSYLRQYMANNYSTGTYLIAQRETWNTSSLSYENPFDEPISVHGNEPPRIASRKSVATDFEIVMTRRQDVSACGNIPQHTVGTILNYGVFDDNPHGLYPDYIIVNPDLQGTDNLDPVVTYDADASEPGRTGDFIVTWTTRSNCPPVADNGLNVVSRTMTHTNEEIPVVPLYDNYSFVNKGNFKMPEQDTRGDQEKPSVAGVYLESGSVYFFKDTEVEKMLYKYSDKLDGRQPLRVAANVTVSSYPNPFQKQATFTVEVPVNDLAQELVIYDVQGRVLDKIKLKEESGLQEVTWKPKARIRNGMYFARIVTLKQTQTIKLVSDN